MNIKKVWNPETFQGINKKNNYFEGWYFKLIDKEHKTVLAIIPGVSISKTNDESHAFIQVIDALKRQVEYYRFPYETFKAETGRFDVYIGENHFSESGITLHLRNENLKIEGKLSFGHIIKYPKTFFSPGIMGPFSFVPNMECYHGIVNIHHKISGCLTVNNDVWDMNEGDGYIEKDWGSSFPNAWIWMQGNHFEKPKTSFMFSVARIPWRGKSFIGLICFLKTETGFYKITTYNGGKIDYINSQESNLNVKIYNKKYMMKFNAIQSAGGFLKAPKNGLMHREIEESITAELSLNLSDFKGNTVFQGTSKWVGMEVSGSIADLV